MSADFDFQNRSLFAAACTRKGLATIVAAALVLRKIFGFQVGRQVGIIAATVSLGAALLTTWPTRMVGGRRGGRRRGHGGCRRFGLAAEELLFTQAKFGFQNVDALLEFVFALTRFLVEGLPVSGLAIRFKFLSESRADGAGFGGEWGCGTSQREPRIGLRVRHRRRKILSHLVGRNAEGSEAEYRGRSVS